MNRKKNASSVSEMAVAAELFVSGFYPSKKRLNKNIIIIIYTTFIINVFNVSIIDNKSIDLKIFDLIINLCYLLTCYTLFIQHK